MATEPTIADLQRAFFKLSIGGAWANDVSQAYPTALSGAGGAIPIASTISANGATAVDHTAGMSVVSTTVPDAGTYSVWLQVATAGGTAVNTDMVNYELRVNGVARLKPIASIATTANILQGYLVLPAGATVSVNCIGAGTAGVRVAASINLTRIA